MEGADAENFKRQLRAFIACDIRITIDDLQLTITYRFKTEELLRFYSVDHIPTEILRELHMDDHIS